MVRIQEDGAGSDAVSAGGVESVVYNGGHVLFYGAGSAAGEEDSERKADNKSVLHVSACEEGRCW